MYFLMNKTNSKLLEIETNSSLVSFNAWDRDFFFAWDGREREREGMNEGDEPESGIWRVKK